MTYRRELCRNHCDISLRSDHASKTDPVLFQAYKVQEYHYLVCIEAEKWICKLMQQINICFDRTFLALSLCGASNTVVVFRIPEATLVKAFGSGVIVQLYMPSVTFAARSNTPTTGLVTTLFISFR